VQSQNRILRFLSVPDARLLVVGVESCASCGSATAIGWDLGPGGDIIVPSSIFFPSLAATLALTQVGPSAFQRKWITSVTIPLRVLNSLLIMFSSCKSLSSISFETDSELAHIEEAIKLGFP
jgi:hypothetical protein